MDAAWLSTRARSSSRAARSPGTAFLLITSAQSEPIDEAIWFRRTLDEIGLPFAGVVVNRVHHDILGREEPDELVAELALELGLGEDLAARIAQNLHDYHVLARRDERNIERLRIELGDSPLLLVPHLDDDVHDVDGLLRVHRYLFASERERERLIDEVVA